MFIFDGVIGEYKGGAPCTVIACQTEKNPFGIVSSPYRLIQSPGWTFVHGVWFLWFSWTMGTVSNEIYSHMDMIPTIMAAVGVPDVKEQLLKGMKVGDKTFKVHLDGYNITDSLAGRGPDPRHEFFYFNDDGSLVGLRYNQWKIVFAEQRAEGFEVWQEPFVVLRLPKIFNLRSDPFEKGDIVGMDYRHWRIDRTFRLFRRSSTLGSSWPRSRNSHRARRWAASRSTRRWRRSSIPQRAATEAALDGNTESAPMRLLAKNLYSTH